MCSKSTSLANIGNGRKRINGYIIPVTIWRKDHHKESRNIFFKRNLQKHFICDFVLYSPLCIAVKYQMHQQSEHTEKVGVLIYF